MEGRGEEGAGDCVDVCAMVDEEFACLASAAYRSPVQRRDVVFVAVCRACTTRLDQGSDAFDLSQSSSGKDVKLPVYPSESGQVFGMKFMKADCPESE